MRHSSAARSRSSSFIMSRVFYAVLSSRSLLHTASHFLPISPEAYGNETYRITSLALSDIAPAFQNPSCWTFCFFLKFWDLPTAFPTLCRMMRQSKLLYISHGTPGSCICSRTCWYPYRPYPMNSLTTRIVLDKFPSIFRRTGLLLQPNERQLSSCYLRRTV